MGNREPCTLHGSLLEGQATIANELMHMRKELEELKILLRGSNGLSGVIGWLQERKGEMKAAAKVHGFVGGMIAMLIAVIVRALVATYTKG